METKDFILLLHPILAVVVVFPLLGMVVNRSLLVRQRRLTTTVDGKKSNIAPTVGKEHVDIGKYLASSVIGISLLGLARPTFGQVIKGNVWVNQPFYVLLLVLLYGGTIASFCVLYQTQLRKWRIIFASLTSIGIIVLSLQDGIFRRDSEWFISHFYYGITATLLMIFSLAILPEIYRDLRWRKIHIIANCLALLLFLGQGMTGTRDLLEIPLSWQESYVYKCDYQRHTCPK